MKLLAAGLKCSVFILALLLALGASSELWAFTLNVVDGDGAPVTGFRWLVEEDTTHPVTPGALVSDSLSLSIHKSHAPVVATGYEAGSSAAVGVPNDKRYVVSVLPDSGHTLSGNNVAIGQGTVTVTVNAFPVPTAQISIFVFEDNNPINNGPDIGEVGLEGFNVLLSDMGGQQIMDAFGNPLGSTYDASGNLLTTGDGIIRTDADGMANIQYIPPGKYGIVIVPPPGSDWIQVTTIEGTPTIDAWVKAGEPKFLVEFGPALTHIFMGFVSPSSLPWALSPPGGSGSITGQVVNSHQSPPPAVQGFPGNPIDGCLVALNDLATGEGLAVEACGEDGFFTFTGVPPGLYQLVVWDTNLIRIIGFQTVSVPDPAVAVDLGQVLSFAWFGTYENYVFNDLNENGFRDCVTPACDNPAAGDEIGILEQNVNIRWRDGTIYQAFPTDVFGYVPFDEVFPFFHWLVTEVDYARFKATGATHIVDDGGAVPPDAGWAMPSGDRLTPQPQLCTQADIDAGLCAALGTPLINPNTGNNLSRTETGVVLTQGMMLFAGQTNRTDWGKKAYTPGSGENGGISGIVFYAVTRAEDDPQYAAAEPWEPGIPRVQVNLYQDFDNDKIIDDLGAPAGVTLADVDNYPLGWADGGLKGAEDVDWNSNGSFDMGDAVDVTWTDSWDDNMPTGCQHDGGTTPIVNGANIADCFDNFGTWNQMRPAVFDGGYAFGPDLPLGFYIVEAATPPGMEILKEEDKNVDYGDEYGVPVPAVLPPECVGDDHLVPAMLSLFQDIPAFYAGQTRKLCDRKRVTVSEGRNAAADFFQFTYVPKAGRAVGFINNDLAAEGNINSINVGEKAGPSWIPVAFLDYAGNEVARVYSDEFGVYNALVPSTFTMNIAAPSGVSPNMLQVCLNHPGPIEDPGSPGTFITDPQYDPQFSFTCYTLNFQPGMTTYLDTPVVPVAAFVNTNPDVNIDRNLPDGTPVINSVNSNVGDGGPYVNSAGDIVTITSLGTVQVPNPLGGGNIPRDFGFGGTEGTVTVDGVEIPAGNVNWAADGLSIQVTIPGGISTGQLMITRGDNGKTTVMGITLHVGFAGPVVYVNSGESIQAAIDLAASGSLLIVTPGTYNENVVLWKNIQLQGSGAPSTQISALPIPGDRITQWNAKVQGLIDANDVDVVPGQPTVDTFFNSTAPGIMVLSTTTEFGGAQARIDGLTVFGATLGGGIYVNGFIDNMSIGNNYVHSNLGTYGGGITVGNVGLDSSNDNLTIHHNFITQNSSNNGGGGISLYAGSTGYSVDANFILNNFSSRDGGGIMHLGLSDGGSISNNAIVFNEVFYGGEIGGNGGGIYIGGENPLAGGVTLGAGSVTVDSNLLQGNVAGADSGGGMAAVQFNGQDVVDNPGAGNQALWYALLFTNNMVVNNVAAYQGGGVFLQDVANVSVLNNTIANNDSTATSTKAGVGNVTGISDPQPAGLAVGAHSATLAANSVQLFSDPDLRDNIIWHNFSYYRDASLNGGLGGLVANGYWDLQVSGVAATLSPEYCILTDTTGYSGTNISADPQFVLEYTNVIYSAGAGDEGGNFVNIAPSPLILEAGDYHILGGSPAVNAGVVTGLTHDFDGDPRPSGLYEIGADEIDTGGPAPISGGNIGLFNGGTWYLDTDGILGFNAATDTTRTFGGTGDKPVTGDWNGDGKTDVGVFRGNWWYLDSDGTPGWNAATDTAIMFGGPGDIPVTGDWNGDLKTDIGVYRNGNWYLDSDGTPGWNAATDTTRTFGGAGDKPVTGDWNGDGTTDIGVFRGNWWYLDSDGTPGWNAATDTAIMFGGPGDKPVTGDWDANGTSNIGVYRDGTWYLDSNGTPGWQGGSDTSILFGTSTDIPVTGAW